MKLYLYIRLSSADDDLKYKNESESIANQRALLHQFVEGQREFYGWDIEEFVDDGYTGTNDDRPAFNRMIEHLRDGDAQLVICKDFSRFFRDYTEIGDYLERIFPFLGVRFISVNDGYDSDDYKGTTAGMEVVMKYIIYSFYSRDLSMKVKTVENARMKRGEYLGSFAPFGYMKDPDRKHHLIPDPETAPIVRQIFSMAIEGKRISEIAQTLNADGVEPPSAYFHRKFPDCRKFRLTTRNKKWEYSNVYDILKRLDYTGAVVGQKKNWKGIDNPRTTVKDRSEWIIVPNCHEALVSEDDYNKAQAVIKKVTHYGRSNQDYPLRSLIRCGVCGRAMARNNRCKRIYYKCENARYDEATLCPVGEKFYEDALETAVINSLRQMLSLIEAQIQLMTKAAQKTKGTEANLKQSLLQIEKSIKQNNLSRVAGYEQYSDRKISRDEFLVLKKRLADELSALNAEKAEIEKALVALEAEKDTELMRLGQEAKLFPKSGDVTNQMLLYFIERVDVYSGMRIEIRYSFSDEIMKLLSNSENMQ